MRADYLLFSESQSRFVVTVKTRRAGEFEKLMDGLPHARVGKVTEEPLLIINERKKRNLVSADVFALKRAWQKPLDW